MGMITNLWDKLERLFHGTRGVSETVDFGNNEQLMEGLRETSVDIVFAGLLHQTQQFRRTYKLHDSDVIYADVPFPSWWTIGDIEMLTARMAEHYVEIGIK